MKITLLVIASVLWFNVTSVFATAVDVHTSSITTRDEAFETCPKICNVAWNGKWQTFDDGVSVCDTYSGIGFKIGPIWNHQDAQKKCPLQLSKVRWSGEWRMTEKEGISVCSCEGPTLLRN